MDEQFSAHFKRKIEIWQRNENEEKRKGRGAFGREILNSIKIKKCLLKSIDIMDQKCL